MDYKELQRDYAVAVSMRNEVIEELYNIENDPNNGAFPLRKIAILEFELAQIEMIMVIMEGKFYANGQN